MTEHILVCPFDEQLLAKLGRRKIVINTGELDNIQNIYREAIKSNKLHAIKIQTDIPLSSISFHKEWVNLPLAIYTQEFGEYRDFLKQLYVVRKLNLRIFLSSQYEANLIGLRIMSSLNISCGLFLIEEPSNWDSLNDLMHYSIYSKTKHAPIEPFGWLASHYEPSEYTDFNIVYFNNPARYLYINEKEQIALTEKDLMNNNFIDEGINSLDNIDENEKFQDFINYRYEIMLQMNECAFCPAFRICLAKFSHLTNKKDTCKVFFSDLLDAADYSYSKKINNGNQLWQL